MIPDKRADDLALNEIIGLIEKAERPVLYCGGGIITGQRRRRIAPIRRGHADSRSPPPSWAAARFPKRIRLSLRWLGMHGAAFANWAVSGEFKHRKSPDEPMVKIERRAPICCWPSACASTTA